ncbi:MAG: histidine kinase [Arachidicoccus sp.]|nr:histidine kinase [Arachidicoccus sp.]
MKSKINYILPIAVAAIFPGLNFFSNTELSFGLTELLKRWLFASLSLYFLWYVLLYAKKKINTHVWLYIVLIVILYIGLIYCIFDNPFSIYGRHLKWQVLLKLFSASILILIIQYSLEANASINRLQLERNRLVLEKYKVQLQELRNKADPHFLFNTLNTLRSMIRKNHPDSEKFVMNLSAFYRQTLKSNSSSTIFLEEECEVFNSYIYLMQTRSEGAIYVKTDIAEKWLHYKIPTLCLQIVVENCIKHNRISSAEPLFISILSKEDGYIAIQNNLLPKISVAEKSGYGLKNIESSYELLNIENGLSVCKTEDSFEVKLKLIAP